MNRVLLSLTMPNLTRETGAALFVSLVFLFILTVIGLAGMQNTSLQEKMASHQREHNLAFQAAESALRAAEAYLATTIPVFDCTGANGTGANDGYYKNSAPGSASDCPASKGWPSSTQIHPYPPEDDRFWNDGGVPNTDVVTLTITNQQFDKLADKPKYIIESLSSGAVGAAVSLEAGIPIPTGPKYYRITARGVGMDANSIVITQSVVRQ